jgi:PAS domain S-box-containing protein
MNQPPLNKPFGTPGSAEDTTGGGHLPGASAPALLLVNEQAEEIKQTTICMRQSYPGCRVEAVYSAEEALEWAPRHDWSVILLDERLAQRHALDVLPELRRQSPASVIIVQAEHHDANTAAKTLQASADLFLYKQSPAFLRELPIVVRRLLEQRALQSALATERERHTCLIEQFPGLLYELDAEGRFVAIGAGVTALLGYSPQELIGTHYATLLHPDERQLARYHLHERRTGLRALHDKQVRLIGKYGGVVKVACRTAGLYGQRRQFLGTIGTMTAPAESSAAPATLSAPIERSFASGPTPVPAPTPSVKEPSPPYPERRSAPRVAVRMAASLHLRDTAYSGFVRDISLANLYVIVTGTPPVRQNHPVRLDFSLEGAILQVQGTIAGVRRSHAYPHTPHQQAGLGLVIRYSDLGVIERPILSSLLKELHSRPGCATLTIVPSHE